MIKHALNIFSIFLFGTAFADTLTLVAYDPTYYKIIEDLGTTIGSAGLLTGVSDIYYYYEPFTWHLTLKQQEWLSDGYGGEVAADYESVFHYTGVTFDNMAKMFEEDTIGVENLRKQVFELLIDPQLAINIPHAKIINSVKYVLTQQNTNIMNTTFNRIHPKGRNGGDGGHDSLGLWGQTLYNYSKRSGNNGFSGNTFGIVLGADGQITDSLIIGLGYNYNSTDISNTDINNNILFFYGKYQLINLFINTMLGYNQGYYEYDNAKDKSHGYFGVLSLGYNTDFDITPSIAVRYMSNKISTTSKYINKYDTNLMTFVSGILYNYSKDGLSLNAHIDLTYDIIKPEQNIIINIPELDYTFVVADNNAPMGLETGFNINLPIKFAKLMIGYDLGIRSRYISHTGMIRLRCEF
ncbi:MAG: autotransporter outer membrane beta-barrel domain-containing protein [Alphaproteobacteria bacterium]|nr:autotransporter outer membrane beta-barrel domain-containing protein [Alphaproteobacteria bacterium]